MGQRISFYQATNGSGLEENIINHYSGFRTWILDEHNNSLNEFDERLISNSLESFLHENVNISGDLLQTIHQKLIDELT